MYQKLRNDMNEQDKPLYEDEPNVIASPNSPMVMHFHEKITFLTYNKYVVYSLASYLN